MAGLSDGEEATIDGHLALAPASGAGDHLGAGGGPGAVAMGAGGRAADGDFFFAALDGLEKIYFEVVAEVGALVGAGAAAASAPTAPAHGFLKNVAKNRATKAAGSKDVAEKFEGIMKTAAGHAAARSKGLVTETVIGLAFLRIGKDFVGLADLLEFFLRLFVALVFVRMVLQGEFAVGLFDFLLGDATADPQNLVVVLFRGHGSGSRRAGGDGDNAGRTEKAVSKLEPTATLMKDGAFRLAGSGFLTEGLVQMGVEGFADGIDGGDTVIGQETFELALNQFEPRNHRCNVWGGSGGLQAKFQMVEQGKKVGEDGLVGVLEGFFFLSGEPLAGVFKIGADAEELVL